MSGSVIARSPMIDDLPVGSADRILRQVASLLLPGGGAIDQPSDPTQVQLLVGLAASERLLGPLLLAVDAGDLVLPPEAMEAAVAGHQDSMLWCLHLEIRLLEVMEWFEHAGGIEFLVIKGPAVAHLDELDPSLRSFADIDLLLRASSMDRGLAVLAEHGAARRIPQRRPGFDRRFVKSVGLECADGVELDIHRTLCVGAHGLRIPLDDLFDQATSFELGGVAVPAPMLVHRALHAAYHAMVGTAFPSLRTLRDLAGYLTMPELTPDVLVAEARRWRGEAVLAEAVDAAFRQLTFDAPAWREWLDAVVEDPRELDIIASTRYETTRPVRLSTIRELSWRDRAAFLWAVGVPSRDDLEARGLTRPGWVVAGIRKGTVTARARVRRS